MQSPVDLTSNYIHKLIHSKSGCDLLRDIFYENNIYIVIA